jgi:hypothetical protein
MKLNQIDRFGSTALSIGASALMTIAISQSIATAMPEPGHKTAESGHGHKMLAIPAGQPQPTAQLIITPDPMKGWNMQIQTTNFTFAPEQIGRRSQASEGHAHLYLNGKKIARIYGPWSHIPSLPAGQNTLRITLNTNNHEDLTIAGKVVEATAIVEVPATATPSPSTQSPTQPPKHSP